MNDFRPGTFHNLVAVRARNSRVGSFGENVINLSHGGMLRGSQHPSVKEAIIQGAEGRNFIGFLKWMAERDNVPLLDYLHRFRPPEYYCDLGKAYLYRYRKKLAKSGGSWTEQGFLSYLEGLAATDISLEHYPPETLGDLECRSILRQYFIEQGIPAHDSLVIFGGYGFRSLYFASLAAVFSMVEGGKRVSNPGTLLTESTFFHGTIGYPTIFGVTHRTFEGFGSRALAGAFRDNRGPKLLLLFSVGNPDGRVLNREELEVVAREVLVYNRNNRGEEVVVVSDENYRGSVLAEDLDDTPSIASIDIPGLGRMHDHTITITSPSKTFALASARVGMATSGNRRLLIEVATWLRQIGAYHIFNPAMLGATAAFACTPRSWVARNNARHRDSIRKVRKLVAEIDESLPGLVSLNDPQGGWYLLLQVNKRKLPDGVRAILRSSNDLHVYLMYYGKITGENVVEPDTGVITFPSSIVTQSTGEEDDVIWVRFTVAEPEEVLAAAFQRIHRALRALFGIQPDHLRDILALGRETAEHGLEYQLAGDGVRYGSDHQLDLEVERRIASV